MKALVLADNHVGQPVRGALTEERLAEQEQAFRDALQLARDHHVDVVLHAGDLFHQKKPEPAVILAAERPLVEHRAVGGPPVVMVNGNHCVSGTAEHAAVDVFAWADLIQLYRRPDVVPVADTHVALLPWSSVARIVAEHGGGARDATNEYAADLLVEVARGLRAQVDGPCVLISHFSVTGAALPSGLPVELAREPILPLLDLEALGFDAIMLGHIHRRQTLCTEPLIGYVGPPIPLSFGEAESDYGVTLLEIDDVGTTATFLPIESRGFVTVECDRDPTDPDSRAGLWWPDMYPQGAYVKVRYPLVAGDHVDQQEVREYLHELGAHRVFLEPMPIRQSRARVEGLDEHVDDRQSLELWLDAHGYVDEDGLPAVRERHAAFLAEVAS